ncbi:GNAT family N-acetyltransferase [Sandaracinus amylolyticus]|nr:GNAT family N-acetyltransferase [Sandaracinus amylolyticus]
MKWTKGEHEIDTEKTRLDVGLIHRFLAEDSYWAKGISRERVERAIERSCCFGLYRGARQLGYARVVSDEVTFAYLCDVFVLPDARGAGLGKWLVEVSTGQHQVRRWMLGTLDAHGLYAQHGFAPMREPQRFMERLDPDIYTRGG